MTATGKAPKIMSTELAQGHRRASTRTNKALATTTTTTTPAATLSPTSAQQLRKKCPESNQGINRPTVNVARPEHRKATFPLFEKEEVVYRSPKSDDVELGCVALTVEDADEEVYVKKKSLGSQTIGKEVIGPLSLKDMYVVKMTDFLIYSGQRYCVFGPPLGMFGKAHWGSAWLDVVGEQRHFRDEDLLQEKILFELKRLDAIMLKYPETPDVPVLVLGFIGSRVDDSEWRVVGLVNYLDENVLGSDHSARANICGMPMAELRKDFAGTNSFLIEDTAELYMTDHPTVKAYHRAMGFIRDWIRIDPQWVPSSSWRQRVAKLYPRGHRNAGAKQVEKALACKKCTTVQKTLDKTKVSVLC
jgi:hypothetical protein